MALNQLVDSRDLKFVLFEMLNIQDLQSFEAWKDLDRSTIESIVDLGEKIAINHFYPANLEGEKQGGATYDPKTKTVKVPSAYPKAFQAYIEAGFPGLIMKEEWGGSGMPEVVWKGALEYLGAGCLSLIMYGTLTLGATRLVGYHANKKQRDLYLDKMIDGSYGGTMCLTEPAAGSDVGALTTKAIPQDNGSYLIKGSKIFISAGDNNLFSNIIHTVLARVEGDQDGTKGISIFLVPKFITNPDGSIGRFNDVICSNIEHKMGIRGSATCTLNFGDHNQCQGWLLGKQGQGMKIMFEMMNEARLDVAFQGLSLASASYLHAATYAKTRKQGTDPLRRQGSVCITEHPDVIRMLLSMKSYVEAMRIISYFATLQMDLIQVLTGEEKKEAQGLLDIMIPILKAGNTDNAWNIGGEAIQVFGGYGFCCEYPVEQYARDSKILSIYEGTNGIQSIDLILRKILMNNEQYNYQLLRKKIMTTLESATKNNVPLTYIDQMHKIINDLDATISNLGSNLSSHGPMNALAQAVPLQKAFKYILYGWAHIWSLSITLPKLDKLIGNPSNEGFKEKLSSSEEAKFYHGKVQASEFFLQSELHLAKAHLNAIAAGSQPILETSGFSFTGTP